MNKEKLIEILNSLEIPVNEGIQNDQNKNVYPRVVFWEYDWDDMLGSGTDYITNVLYQVSFFSQIPRHPKLIKLKKQLNDNGLHPAISHEYIQDGRYFHSYFGVEVRENIE